jgi:hypothetical protein
LTISAKLMPTTTDVEVQRTLPYKKLARTI